MAELECRESGESLEIVDPYLPDPIVRLKPTTSVDQPGGRVVTSSAAAVASLGEALAPVSAIISQTAAAGKSLQVAFTPSIQAAIDSGALHLMQGSAGQLPTAVDSLGRIRANAHVVQQVGALSAGALLPVLLPAAAAAAASYYQHQALQATLDGIRDVVDRIEERLRDDDWAVLEAGDELALALVSDERGWDVPDQLRMELAVTRQSAERVFRSRRRFAHNLVRELDADTFGRTDPWTDRVKRLMKGEHNWIEVSLFLHAMVVRARLTEATAFILAADGDAQASSVLTRSSIEQLSASYVPLAKALAPLAERRPEAGLLDRIPGRRASDEERFRFVGDLVQQMDAGVGQALRSLDAESVVTLPAHEVKALEQAN